MVSTQNTSRSNANPPGNADNKPPDTLEAMQANTSEVEALRLTNQRLIGELEQLTRQMQRPREARQTQEGHNIPPREGQHNLDILRGAEIEAESNRARGHGSQLAPGDEGNGVTLEGRVEIEELHHPQQGAGDQSWEQRFKSLQQELSRVKEMVRGRAPDTMDTLVQQTESPYIAEVLHFPLPAKFRMPQVEAFDGTRDPVDHLNTYKNQMELHGYQDLVRCRAFAITQKGPALAWFNRLPPSSISSFRELSIAFVFHFIGARTYRKPSYHMLTIKQSSQESLRSYVQRFNAESLKVYILDEKFTITAFIAGLGVQSKDLMFSISKNPQASMAEVLAKAEKYINSEEAPYPRKEALQPTKKRAGQTSDEDRTLKDKATGRGLQRKMKNGPRKGTGTSETVWAHLNPRDDYSPRRFTPLTASVSQVLREVRNE